MELPPRLRIAVLISNRSRALVVRFFRRFPENEKLADVRFFRISDEPSAKGLTESELEEYRKSLGEAIVDEADEHAEDF